MDRETDSQVQLPCTGGSRETVHAVCLCRPPDLSCQAGEGGDGHRLSRSVHRLYSEHPYYISDTYTHM